LKTAQRATIDKLDSVTRFLGSEGKCLVVCPHHDSAVTGTGIDDRLISIAQHRTLSCLPDNGSERLRGHSSTASGFQLTADSGSARRHSRTIDPNSPANLISAAISTERDCSPA